MRSFLRAAILILLFGLVVSTPDFRAWQHQYRKRYANVEEKMRREAIWTRNLREIRAHNANGMKQYTMGLNYFSDLAKGEIDAMMGFRSTEAVWAHCNSTSHAKARALAPLPKSVDWRQHGAVTPVKNQGHCGSYVLRVRVRVRVRVREGQRQG